jgi:hypothetical protein
VLNSEKDNHADRKEQTQPRADVSDELEAFVMVHDQDLLLECERLGRFSALPRMRYVFLGGRPTDEVATRRDVVIARSLPDHLEQYPHLLSFTGWYAVARNHLATSRYVALLEYDVTLSPGFRSQTVAALLNRRCIAGYIPFPLSHPMYLHATPWLIRALAEVYQIDAVRLIGDHLAAGGLDRWTATSNASMAAVDLAALVDWILPLTRVYRHEPIGAHVHERLLKIFCLLNDLENVYLPDLLTHTQARSHQIFALSRDEAAQRARTTPLSTDGGSSA